MIYTSYFANYKKLPSNITPISIARITPKWFIGLEYKKLAPSWELLNYYKTTEDKVKYNNLFKIELNKLNPHMVINELQILANQNNNIVLLCYEKPNTFCHRHLVSQWLTENGYPTQEFIYGNKNS